MIPSNSNQPENYLQTFGNSLAAQLASSLAGWSTKGGGHAAYLVLHSRDVRSSLGAVVPARKTRQTECPIPPCKPRGEGRAPPQHARHAQHHKAWRCPRKATPNMEGSFFKRNDVRTRPVIFTHFFNMKTQRNKTHKYSDKDRTRKKQYIFRT